jgi:L-asparaginase II
MSDDARALDSRLNVDSIVDGVRDGARSNRSARPDAAIAVCGSFPNLSLDETTSSTLMNGTTLNPVLVRFLRGSRVESEHRGRYCVVESGRVVRSAGDHESPVFWRSAAKPFQAAAVLESGAGDRFALTREDIALLSSSHNGEDIHLERARSLLERGQLDEAALQCGPHPSIAPKVASELAARGEKPRKLRSNCSGKHSGMLLLTRHLGADPATYLDPAHPTQQRIVAAIDAIAELHGVPPEVAIDGCSAPTFALPLNALALGFARLSNPGPELGRYEEPLRMVRDSMLEHPYLVAGKNRFDTDVMGTLSGRVVSKIGAEGVLAMGIVGRGIGIAVKIDDGAARAYEALAIDLLEGLGVIDATDRSALAPYSSRSIRNSRAWRPVESR